MYCRRRLGTLLHVAVVLVLIAVYEQNSECDQCKPSNKSFPACVPDVRDGTLGSWGAWGSWSDGVCGPYDARSYKRTRTRRRQCDDSTKNVHGRSCADQTEETQVENVYRCSKVTRLGFQVHDSKNSGGNKASYYMKIQQGDIICTTNAATWYDPGRGTYQYKSGSHGCTKTFDRTRPVKIWLYSNSGDYLWIDSLGIYLDNTSLIKHFSPYSDPIYRNSNEGPYTVYP